MNANAETPENAAIAQMGITRGWIKVSKPAKTRPQVSARSRCLDDMRSERQIDCEIKALERRMKKVQRLRELRSEALAAELDELSKPGNKLILVILEVVCARFDVPVSEVMALIRQRRVIIPRHTVFYLAHRVYKMTSPSVAALLNKREHGTVLHGAKECERRMETDDDFRTAIEEMKAAIEKRLAASTEGLNE